MEAAVAEKEAGMTEWNDGRLDDFSKRVDRVEKKMDEGFNRLDRKMDEGFARIDSKFDELNRMLFKAAWGLAIGLLGLVGVIAAQL